MDGNVMVTILFAFTVEVTKFVILSEFDERMAWQVACPEVSAEEGQLDVASASTSLSARLSGLGEGRETVTTSVLRIEYGLANCKTMPDAVQTT